MPESIDSEEALREYGAVGSSNAGSYSDEYLAELRWPKNIEVYDKMRKSDGQVKAMLLVMELPIRSTGWFIKPASEDDRDKEVAEFVSNNLFSGPPEGLTQHFDDFLRLALTMLPFGYSVFEIVFDIKDGMYEWKKFAHRPQRTIREFIYDDEGGPEAIEQVKYGRSSRGVVEIPIEKLIIFSNRLESGDMRGSSILRSAYKHWKIKDFIYKILNIGIERNLVGTPDMELPEDPSEAEKKKAREIVQNITSGESSGITRPKGFVLDIFEGKRGMMEVLPYIEHHDQEMSKSILAQFLNLGEGSTGSYALSKDQSDLFLMSLNSTAKYIKQTFNSYAIPQLVNLNWGNENLGGYPELDYNPISANEALLDTVHKMVTGQVVAPDDNIEEWVRDMLELPEKAEEDEVGEEGVEASDSSSYNVGLDLQEHKDHDGDCGCVDNLLERYENRTFEEGERVWRRDLTAWEKEVSLEEIEQQFDSAEELFLEQGDEITQKQIEDLFKRMQKLVEAGELDEIAKIPVRYRGEFTDFLSKQQRDLIDFGKEQASDEVGVDPEAISVDNEKRRAVNAKSGVVADNIAQRIKTAMALDCLTRLEHGETEKSALYGARQAAEDRAERELKGSASATVGDAINDGRSLTAEQTNVELAQFSAILDDYVCELCEWMDGMIIRLDNPDYDRFSPLIHYHCRCLWVYIDPEEEPQPEPDWETPPDSLIEEFGNFVS